MDEIPPPENCRYCGFEVQLREGAYGKYYICTNCGAKVGCHRDTDIPLGILADKKLREARLLAHRVFDSIWQSGAMTRTETYKTFAKMMGVEKLHIGMLDIDDIKKLIGLLDEYYYRWIVEVDND